MTTKLPEWICQNIKKLNISLNELAWINTLFKEYFSYHASIQINGSKFYGSAWANTKELAAEKAITEAIERAVFFEISEKTSTNGLALHVCKEKAQEAAIHELYERDIFLCHYLTKTPWADITFQTLDSNAFLKKTWEHYNAKNIHLKLGLLFSSKEYSTVVCIALGRNYEKPFGSIMGLAGSSTLENAILKSLFECIPNIESHIALDSPTILTLEQFIKIKKVSTLDHLYLAKNFENDKYLFSLFKENVSPVDSEFHETRTNVQELVLPSWCADSGLYAFQASNKLLQDFFVGMTTQEKINFKRMNSFTGKNITFNDLHYYPHPFP